MDFFSETSGLEEARLFPVDFFVPTQVSGRTLKLIVKEALSL